jgi:hypothetical protein
MIETLTPEQIIRSAIGAFGILSHWTDHIEFCFGMSDEQRFNDVSQEG